MNLKMGPPIMENHTMIEWTKDKRERLRKACKAERAKGMNRHGIFQFDGHDFVLGYAEYLVEYLDMRMK